MKPPIIVGGCPSSGTTLLRAILDSHPAIYCGPELGIFDRLFIYREAFDAFRNLIEITGQLKNQTFAVTGNRQKKIDLLPAVLNASSFFSAGTHFHPSPNTNFAYYMESWDEVVKLSQKSRNYDDFFNSFFMQAADKNCKIRWAEKTPENIYCFSESSRKFPGYRFVHMLRHPFDVIASLKNRKKNPILFQDSLNRYIAAWLERRRMIKQASYYEIRYEKLVEEPEDTIRHLMAFCEEEFTREQLYFFDFKRPATGGYAETPIHRDSIGRGRNDLSMSELKAAAKELNSFIPEVNEIYDLSV